MFFTTLQESLRIQKEYTWDNWINIGVLPSNLGCLVEMNIDARKQYTLMVSFVAACLGSSIAETS